MRITKIIPASTTDTIVIIDIPDPVTTYSQAAPTVAPPVISTTQGQPVITISGGTPPDSSTTSTTTITTIPSTGGTINFVVDQIPATDPEINGPGRGLINFYQKQIFPYTASVNYFRLSWAQIQTGPSTYDWSYFDSVVKACRAANQTLQFRIGILDNSAIGGTITVGGNKASYPVFVHNGMTAESVKPWSSSGYWYPNWNSDFLQLAWESFLQVVAKHIDDTCPELIYSIDISGYGNYLAEWHMDSIPEPAANKATTASLIRMGNASVTAFPNYPLVTNVNMFDTRYANDQFASWAITGKNAWGLFGFRSDHVGWFGPTGNDYKMQNRVVSGVNISTELQKRRNFAPMLAEPMNGTSGLTPSGGKAFDTMIDEVMHYGFSTIENEGGITSADAKANYLKASKASGYRLAVTGGSFNAGQLQLTWTNIGVAPTYENWDVIYEIRNAASQVLWTGKSTFSPKLFITGTKIINDTIGNVAGNLYIIVKDPTGYKKPLPLAIKGRGSDGSYFLTSTI